MVKALERIDNRLRWIDQTRLPAVVDYKESDDYFEIIRAIKRLEIRGAPAIGIAAAYGLAVAVERAKIYNPDFIRKVGSEFKNARPTAVNLSWAVDRVLARLNDSEGNPISDAQPLWEEAEEIHREDEQMCEKIGANGAELIEDGSTILTHCNAGALATGGIGTALGVIYTCRNQGKNIKVYVDETRPLLQGARLTAWELMHEKIDTTLICDNTAGMLMRQGKIDCVIVGADRIARNGDIANKIGTYPVAVLAREHDVPFYVAAPASTFDDNIKTGDDITIEERAPEEVTRGFGRATAPDDTKVYSPAFDITPHNLISQYITDSGNKPGGREQS
ncbi:MAG: S-methyl-5-thioribose-1-phosphate isomerase [Candidatus Zixiibacteriota bacterium]|nr:MAG: S-methyl-5-thioribose-1-phosphate isomerase [candidate division Zixibacteria bacterium]